MATPTAQQQPVAPPANPGPIKRLLLIALIAILAAGAAAGGTWYFLSRHQTRAPASAIALPQQTTPVFFVLDPMTVNLLSEDGETHYLRIGLTLRLSDQETQDYLTQHMPEIRSRVLLALSNKHPADLAPLEGKRALATELAALISQPSDPHSKPVRIDEVLFTEFVVQ
ncbi:flagellar basal body-associated protein FliL [Paraburkholderia caballeronis]|uniref:Flagellar protein FliL n=1 Tax=Paraburkholderia caballeronis TaxID=416943 RepID=A0A1H7SKL3_9BURK|nr:flagellar basal body-associated protein FliL [Paraburkholderia caballeronis]PXW22359.1 flagellar FliL protein [Paraburkholderia caballeronis]PXW96017.1 flagellar FliL protein [Paraburkholderia caballeronis]RAJ92383.1 flagellar FliL protein [Paraburkholderia caballeronis]TDV08072.1 flagellar FliL protein [Paraburkholderia caballeronis]TDV11864.1 flagellar FliL protein [Paraburkholderia caballeronis]